MLLKKGLHLPECDELPLTHVSIQNLTRTMVLREDQAKATYTQKVDFAKLRSELFSADSTESSTTRASHERLTNDLAKLNSRLRDEVSRTQASVRLDLNLEKGRIREEANVQELKIKETEAKIEQEVAGLREKLEGVKVRRKISSFYYLYCGFFRRVSIWFEKPPLSQGKPDTLHFLSLKCDKFTIPGYWVQHSTLGSF